MISELRNLFTENNPLILGSKSPQRKRILEMFHIPFLAVSSTFEEKIDVHLSPEKNAEMLAEGKASDVFSSHPDSFVIGVDTIVVSENGKILEKPKDEDDARKMFLEKSGTQEDIISGICICSPFGKARDHEIAQVRFCDFSGDDVEYMVNLREWEGKSGAIAIEGKSSLFINEINGNFWNIVGFPAPTFLSMMDTILSSKER